MKEKKYSVVTKILIYFFALLFIVFGIVFLTFNFAIKRYAKEEIKTQVRDSKKRAEEVINKNSNNRFLLERDLRDNSTNVRVLFLDSNNKYVKPEVYYKDRFNGLNPKNYDDYKIDDNSSLSKTNDVTETNKDMIGRGSGFGAFKGQGPERKNAENLANAIEKEGIDLNNDDVKQIFVGKDEYYYQAISLKDKLQNTLVAYIRVDTFTDFIKTMEKILLTLLLPILLISFFIIRYLSKAIAKPIDKLVGLSNRIGSGDFKGEDFNIKEKELHELNMSMNETASKLKTYHDNQKVFFQNVSHELRTPLTSIKGYTEGIKYGVFKEEEATNVIMEESEKLEKLVDDILYLSRLEANESLVSQKSEIELSELLYEARENVINKAKVNNKKIEILVKNDIKVFVYYEELLKGITNILTNAIKYSKENIKMISSIQDNDLVIKIIDDGDGIEKEVLDNIFQRFTKGKFGNTGIGLSIAKASVLMHKGTIKAENDVLGTTFTITIPLDNLKE